MIKLTSKCSECDETGFYQNILPKETCKNCNGSGKTVLEFRFEESNNAAIHYSQIDGSNKLILWIRELKWRLYQLTYKSIPLFLVFNEEQECPECKGRGSFMGEPTGVNKYDEISHSYTKCPNCTEGKVEVVTGFYVFGSKKEYDEKIFDKIYYEFKVMYKELYPMEDNRLYYKFKNKLLELKGE